MYVKPKKYLGQHFLTDQTVAQRIVAALSGDISTTLEVGPGMGVLTQYLLERDDVNLSVIEIDDESVVYLFTVPPGAFFPPPKVQSAVIRLTRNSREDIPCSQKAFKEVIKGAFNQRRKI